MPTRGLILFAACALCACASGPHPALEVAQSDLGCEQSGLKLHQIYPKKVRIEGCGRQGIYVDACDGYGIDAECGWHRYYETEFERDAARRERAEREEAKARQAEEAQAERERAEREEAELAAAEQEAAEREKAEKERAEKEAEQSASPDEESGEDDESEPEARETKPKRAKKRRHKQESLDAFLK